LNYYTTQMRFGKTQPCSKIDSSGRDILLTGIPRSGTTLACRLLCDYSQTIALNEPMDRDQFADPKAAQENIEKHFETFRRTLLENGTAVARTKGGVITDNAFSTAGTDRKRVVERTSIHFDKSLDSDFTLLMKHCAEFSLQLPELAAVYDIYAFIRNPLAVLVSWSSVNVPVSRGKVAKSARLNPGFHAQLAQIGDDLLKRQLFILSWYFERYIDFDQDHIIRYEDLTTAPEHSLAGLSKGELESPPSLLKNRNAIVHLSQHKIQELGEALLNSDGCYWRFYSRKEVEQLLHEMMTND